jgi:hypothetical protein
MKKGFTALVASAVMCSVAFASPTANESSFTGLNATEHAALFGESSVSQVVALDSAEMKVTEGEWLPFWYAGVYAYRAYRIYKAVPFGTARTLTIGWASSKAY